MSKKIELRPLISGFDFALLEVRNLCVASRLKKGDNSECMCCGVSQQKAEMTFCLTGYDAYGFDLDHTLAKYKLTELCRVCNCQQIELTTISYMPTLERLKAVGGGVVFFFRRTQNGAFCCILDIKSV